MLRKFVGFKASPLAEDLDVVGGPVPGSPTEGQDQRGDAEIVAAEEEVRRDEGDEGVDELRGDEDALGLPLARVEGLVLPEQAEALRDGADELVHPVARVAREVAEAGDEFVVGGEVVLEEDLGDVEVEHLPHDVHCHGRREEGDEVDLDVRLDRVVWHQAPPGNQTNVFARFTSM